MSKIKLLLDFVLNTAASLKGTGIHLIRIAIFIIFIWIGGLKFWNYEAEGIVPEYKDYKLKEGEFDKVKHEWHKANNTYTFSRGLGIAIMSFGFLTLLGIWFPKVGFVGSGLVILMMFGTLSFLVTTPEVWVPDLGSGEHGFPLLTGAGRLVLKDVCILAGAVVVLADCAQRILKRNKK